jgi:hypothetical protein
MVFLRLSNYKFYYPFLKFFLSFKIITVKGSTKVNKNNITIFKILRLQPVMFRQRNYL